MEPIEGTGTLPSVLHPFADMMKAIEGTGTGAGAAGAAGTTVLLAGAGAGAGAVAVLLAGAGAGAGAVAVLLAGAEAARGERLETLLRACLSFLGDGAITKEEAVVEGDPMAKALPCNR